MEHLPDEGILDVGGDVLKGYLVVLEEKLEVAFFDRQGSRERFFRLLLEQLIFYEFIKMHL